MKDIDFSRSQIEFYIDQWIFNEVDRELLKRRMLDGINFEQLSDEFGLSVRQTKNRVYKAKTRLYKHLHITIARK